MKKNISINICGTIYAIDEDAYQLLENYLQSMKNYFHHQEGGEEIADDIEHRVAELLWERKEHGMTAVTIEIVKEIIDKVGNPADIANSTSSEQSSSSGIYEKENDAYKRSENFFSSFGDGTSVFGKVMKSINSRRFYRNGENNMLGGVCSGLADYLGVGDVVIWRLAVVVLSFFCYCFFDGLFDNFTVFGLFSINISFISGIMSYVVPIAYVVAWIVFPEAKTSEDRLKMQGKDVNPENLREQVVTDSEVKKPKQVNEVSKSAFTGCLKVILMLVFLILMLPLIIAFVSVLFALFVVCVFVFQGTSVVSDLFPGNEWLVEPISLCQPILWTGLIAALAVVCLAIYAIVRMLKSNTKPLSSGVVTSLVIVWFVALAVAIGSFVVGAMKVSHHYSELQAKESTRNGIYLADKYDWQVLDELGWALNAFDNAGSYLADNRTGYGNLPDKALKFRRLNDEATMTFALTRTEDYEEGEYVLESLIDSDGKGASIKAFVDSVEVASNDLADKGSQIWTMDWAEGSKLPIFENPDSAGWDGFAKGGVEHWTYRVSQPFHHKGGSITIKVSADKAYLNRFYVRQVRLRKVGKDASDTNHK